MTKIIVTHFCICSFHTDTIKLILFVTIFEDIEEISFFSITNFLKTQTFGLFHKINQFVLFSCFRGMYIKLAFVWYPMYPVSFPQFQNIRQSAMIKK